MNVGYTIANRSGQAKVSGTRDQLIDAGDVYLSDPQVMRDPATRRLYFSALEHAAEPGRNNGRPGLAWGFSKTEIRCPQKTSACTSTH